MQGFGTGYVIRADGGGSWSTQETFAATGAVVRNVLSDSDTEVMLLHPAGFDWMFSGFTTTCRFDPARTQTGNLSTGHAADGVSFADFNFDGKEEFLIAEKSTGDYTHFRWGGVSFIETNQVSGFLLGFSWILALDSDQNGAHETYWEQAGDLYRARYSGLLIVNNTLTGGYGPPLNQYRPHVSNVLDTLPEEILTPGVDASTPIIRCVQTGGFMPDAMCATGPLTELITGVSVDDLTSSDFDGNGLIDIAWLGRDGMGNPQVLVLLQEPARAFTLLTQEAVSGWTAIAAADYEGDGDIDIVGYNGAGLEVLLNGPVCGPEICDAIDNDCNGIVDDMASGCAAGESCHWGTCFTDCSMPGDCPGEVCYVDDDRCDDPSDPCTNVVCPGAQACFGGACFDTCTSDAECNPVDETCYNSMRCVKNSDPCLEVQCPYGEVCYQGGCFTSCMDDGDCGMPEYCYANRCTADPCTDVDCPVGNTCYGGSCFVSCGLDIECDPTEVCYDADHCAVDACDGVQCPSSQTGGGDPWHIQSFITTGANETGGIVLGPFRADRQWNIEIFPSFSGDIDSWELYDGERFIGYPVSSTQPLRIFTDDFGGGDVITPVAGTPCNTGSDGICSVGTALECVNWDMVCYETVAPWSVEVCDGLDNDCDGDVDEDVTYPMVFGKVDGLTGWNNVPTLNDNKPVYDHLDYTAHGGDDRDGSVNPLRADGSPMQDAPMRSTFYAYRNFDTGQISILMVHGQRLTGASAAGLSDEDVKLEIELRNGTQMERMFVSYYDDRAPDPDGDDEILRNWDPGDRDFRMEWRVNSTNGPDTWESDAVALNTLWGADDSLVEFTIEWRDYYDDDDASNPFAWRVYRPGIGIDSISSHRRVRLRVDGKQGDDAYCFSSPATFAGCDYGKLQCDPGGITSCTPASDAVCLGCPDIDGDGFPGFDPAICPMGNDCDDGNPNVNPNAPEMCNGLDDDCDGEIDIKTSGCPGGAALCGPDECGFAVSCQCPGGPEIPGDPPPSPACTCGESLTE